MNTRSIIISLGLSLAWLLGLVLWVLLYGVPHVSQAMPMRTVVSEQPDDLARLHAEIAELKKDLQNLKVQIKTRDSVIKQYEAQIKDLEGTRPKQAAIYKELKTKTTTEAEVTHETLRILGEFGITHVQFVP